MLVIRMQRTGRKGHAMFRVVVQDSRQAPTSGKVVVRLGSYDPHGKTLVLDKEKAAFYLEHGAQPSDRVAHLLKAEGVKLPGWVKESSKQKREVRNPDKRRSTAPAKPAEPVEEASEPAEAEAPAEKPAAEEVAADEAPASEPETQPESESEPAEEPADKSEENSGNDTEEAPEKPAE